MQPIFLLPINFFLNNNSDNDSRNANDPHGQQCLYEKSIVGAKHLQCAQNAFLRSAVNDIGLKSDKVTKHIDY